jgi:hypothetical protein
MILSIAIKATVILALALAAAALARRARASVRHGLLGSLFMALLLLPMAGLLVPANELALPAAAPQALTTVAVMTAPPGVASSTASEAAVAPLRPAWNWITLAASLYLGGVALLLLSLAAGVWRLRRWSLHAKVWVEATTIATEVARDGAVRRAVPLR